MAITVFGAALRLYQLDAQPLWLDEVSSLRNAYAFGADGLEGAAAADQVAPLHTIILWLAIQVGGNSEFSLRMPSVIAGVLLIPLIYIVAVRMFASELVGVIAAGLVAISPFAIWYAQEARMYSFFLLAGTGYVALAWPVTYRRLSGYELILLTAVTLIGFAAHHYMALVCAAFALFLVLRGDALKPRSWAWLATQVIAFLIFSYWIYLTLSKFGGAAGSEKPAALFWIPYTFYAFVVGFSFGPPPRALAGAGSDAVQLVTDNAWAIATCGVGTLVLALFGARKVFRQEHRTAGLWLMLWLVLPLALSIFATFVTRIEFNVRYVTASYSAMILLLALGVSELVLPQSDGSLSRTRMRGFATTKPARLLGLASALVIVACMATSVLNLFTSSTYAKEDVRALARELESVSPDTILATDNSRVVKVLRYYGGFTPVRDLQTDRRDICGRLPNQVWSFLEATQSLASNEIWLIEYRSWESDGAHYLRSQLDQRATLVSVSALNGIDIRRYRPLNEDAVPVKSIPLSSWRSAPISQATWTMLGIGVCD